MPLFAPEFKAHFGEESEFVRGLADILNLGLATGQEKAGHLPYPELVLRLSDDESVDCLRDLLREGDDLPKIAMQVALGQLEFDALDQAVGSELRPGSFAEWLQNFEKREFEACRTLLTPTDH